MPRQRAHICPQMYKLKTSKLILFVFIQLSINFKDKLKIKFRIFFFFFRLALYVYEYLMHIGAKQAAQTFLNEVSY